MAREDRVEQMDVEMEEKTERIGKHHLHPLRELLSLSDPDLLGGNSCVLLELLNETHGMSDRLAKRQRLQTTSERIEKWNIPNARADAVFCSLWEKNLELEVLKKAQALVPTQFGEMESEIVQRKAEGDKWKVELLKGIVFKMNKEIYGLEQEVQELMHEAGQKNMDMEGIRGKEQELVHEVTEKYLDVEAILRTAAAETELRVASMGATARKAKEDHLRIESLEKELTEKSRATEFLAIRIKEITARLLSSMEAMQRKAIDDKSRIELLQKQLAEKSEKVLEIRKAKALADKCGETKLEMACKLAEKEGEASRPAEDLLTKADSENFRAAKRAKVEGGLEGIRMELAGDEDEADGSHRNEIGVPNDNLNINDSNHVPCGVETNSGEEEVGGHLADRSDRDELQLGHVAERNDKGELKGGHVAERDDGDELQGDGAAKKKNSHSSNCVGNLQRGDYFVPAVSSKLLGPNAIPKTEKLPENTLEQAKSLLTRDESDDEGEEFLKLVDNSPNKSPLRTVRMGSPQVPFGSQSVHNEAHHMPEQRASSPVTSTKCHNESTPSLERHSDEEELQILVPDPDFHNFDSARTETDILPGQVWAVYDDRDGMPRFYAHINSTQTKPFKTHVNWLELCRATDEEIACTESTGLSITCGDFKMGGADVMDRINTFSHCVLGKVSGGQLKIYPKKGQVWAVYRDLEQGIGPTGGPRFHGERRTLKFEMVEILSEFCDKNGLRTGTLVKVHGFTAVYRRQDAIEAFRSFKPEELAKFSHSVPNQRIEDSQTEAHGIPIGSLELDPASIASDLIMSRSDPSTVQKSKKTPKWVNLLNPIAKLPTNVGSRIRNRVRDALEAGPPEWAVELLEQSISHQVYKGNAAGPTKRIVINILNKVRG